MGKSLIIKGANFLENGIGSFVNMTVFNTRTQGKFKVNYPELDNSNHHAEFLNLSENSAASYWCVEWADVENLEGRTLQISYNGAFEETNNAVVFLNVLLAAIRDSDYTRSTFNISNNNIAGYDKFDVEGEDLTVTVPTGAKYLYVSYLTENPPVVRII